MKLIVLDFISPININIDKNEDTIFFPITPYGIYICELLDLNFIHIHQSITQEKYRDDLYDIFYEYKDILEKNKENLGLYYKSLQLLSYFYCLYQIIKILQEYKNKDYKIELITDKIEFLEVDKFNILDNNLSLIDKIFLLDSIQRVQKITINKTILIIRYLNKINFTNLKKLYKKFQKVRLTYDWEFISPKIKKIEYKFNFINKSIEKELINFIKNEFNFEDMINKIFIKNLNLKFAESIITTNYFTFPSANKFYEMIWLKTLNEKIFMFQHGSYYYHHVYKHKSYNLQINEVKFSDINFVFNDYTKKLFLDLGAKEVHSVGSIMLNKPIKEKIKTYDYLYITQGHDYLGNIQYVDFPNSLHSFDGYELYQRHESIIKLFGTKFKDKKIMIRVHPCVVTAGVYVPFWELAEEYKNITIDVSIPMQTLIEQSKYIISDYFTTEFINRELHYKRDIILFQGAPTPLPEETIEDMEKMFILVDTVNNLEEKVLNIENITKNRKRYDDIIEYYSSKKCDTN
jgi:hypothetical protein